MTREKTHLELSSNKKELLTALLESSVISTLILEMTWKRIKYWLLSIEVDGEHCEKNIEANREEIVVNYISGYTSCIIVVIPVQSTYSIQLLNTQDLKKPNMQCQREREREKGWICCVHTFECMQMCQMAPDLSPLMSLEFRKHKANPDHQHVTWKYTHTHTHTY